MRPPMVRESIRGELEDSGVSSFILTAPRG